MIINLPSKAFVHVPDRCIIAPTADNKITFVSDAYKLEKLVATVNGEKIALGADHSLDLSPFLFPSIIEIAVCLYVGGTVAMKWYLEPLTVKEDDTEYTLSPEIAELREEIAALKAKNEKLVAAVLELKTIIEGD